MVDRRSVWRIGDKDTPAAILDTEQATTSGTAIDFTGIRAGAKRITVMFAGVSTNGTSVIIVQLGDAGGIEATGYVGTTVDLDSTPTSGVLSTGFIIKDTTVAAEVHDGRMVFTLEDAANNTWACSSLVGAGSNIGLCAGTKSLSAPLDQIRLTTAGGVNTFDAGAVNILVE